MASICQVVETLLKVLKCQVCGDGPKAGQSHHWYKCLSCHSTCELCSRALVCKCGKPISQEHCQVIEELLNMKIMRFKCQNQSRGCQEIFDEEAMISHQSKCDYRLVKCPKNNCDYQVPLLELPKHVNDNQHLYEHITSFLPISPISPPPFWNLMEATKHFFIKDPNEA